MFTKLNNHGVCKVAQRCVTSPLMKCGASCWVTVMTGSLLEFVQM